MKKTIKERFDAKVDMRGDDECWPWMAGRNKDGYGIIKVMGRTELAHRMAYLLTKGPIPTGFDICHSCDVPPCQNPRHLWPGTNLQNRQDSTAKGRAAHGEDNGSAKLNEDQVREIRRFSSEGLTQRKIAKWMGVSVAQISNIVRGKQWQHVSQDEG